MKKQLFHDLLTEHPTSMSSLWGFYVLSFLFHVLMIFVFLSIDLKPPENLGNLQNKRVEANSGNRAAVRDRGDSRSEIPVSARQDDRNAFDQGNRIGEEREKASYSDNQRYTEPENDHYQYAVDSGSSSQVQPAVYRHTVMQLDGNLSGDQYLKLYHKPFVEAGKLPQSSFPVRRVPKNHNPLTQIKKYIDHSEMPPNDLIKIEEMINYFSYDFPQPEEGQPFAVTIEVNACPWQESHLLLSIGIQSKIVEADEKLRKRDFVIVRDLNTRVIFDDNYIKAYRLIGYAHQKPIPGKNDGEEKFNENSVLRMGQRMTTLYELIPQTLPKETVEDSHVLKIADIDFDFLDLDDEKDQRTHVSLQADWDIKNELDASEDFYISAVAAQFGMILQNPVISRHIDIDHLIQQVKENLGEDPEGQRTEFIKLLEAYKTMQQ